MTMGDMRLYLMSQYPNSMSWHEKVRNMPTKMVVAIYKRFTEKKEKVEDPNYHQINMFEYMASLSENHTEVKV